MLGARGKEEVEIKLRLESSEQGRRLLRRAGFRVLRRRVHEDNAVLDTSAGSLRKRGLVLRLRRAGRSAVLTLKGPAAGGKYKSRHELETNLPDFSVSEAILGGLGFRNVFRYEKYRTQYRGTDPKGVVMLDETPIGAFLELEGEPGWIDLTAGLLGFSESHYITATYADLFRTCCRQWKRAPGDMTFAFVMPSEGTGRGCRRAGPHRPT